MSRPILSIITVNKNNSPGLITTLSSLMKQDDRDFQWVFIDGNSEDDSLSIAKNFIRNGDVLVSEPDSGIYNAMNKGIKCAEGRYIIFLNSGDSFFDKNSIDLIKENLKKDYEIIMFGFRHKNRVQMPKQNWWRYWSMPTSHQAIIYKESCFTNNLYNENYKFAADFDHYLLINKKKIAIKRDRKILVLNEDYGTDMHLDLVLDEYKQILIKFGIPLFISNIINNFKKYYLKSIIK